MNSEISRCCHKFSGRSVELQRIENGTPQKIEKESIDCSKGLIQNDNFDKEG